MFGYNPSKDSSDKGMEQPLVWVEKDVDRSPSELLWVDSKKWGPLNGSLLSFSYGYGKVFVVPHEKIGNQIQGGLFELPIPKFSTGLCAEDSILQMVNYTPVACLHGDQVSQSWVVFTEYGTWVKNQPFPLAYMSKRKAYA
jgi:hypothetical protein